jgi:hypothetical protein
MKGKKGLEASGQTQSADAAACPIIRQGGSPNCCPGTGRLSSSSITTSPPDLPSAQLCRRVFLGCVSEDGTRWTRGCLQPGGKGKASHHGAFQVRTR